MAVGAKIKHLTLVSAATVACLMLAGCTSQDDKADTFSACLDTVTLQFSAISMGAGAAPTCGPSEAAVSWLADVPGTGEQAARAVPTEAAPGATGDTGAAGADGADGAVGATGVKGDTGDSADGVDGATGAKGDSGTDGVDGATGATGDTGAQGTQGVDGDTGVKGDTGADGVAGVAGATGAAGLPGKNGNSILNGSGLPSDALGADGDFYLDITDFAVYGPRSAGAWQGTPQPLIGPQGPIGPQGLQGVAGETGAAGSEGAAGTSGSTGQQGIQGLHGVDGAQGLTGLTGPAGKDGATGPQGPAGPAGPAGGTAVADPNPNDLTYRMKIGADPAVQITGFTQTVTNSGTTQSGSGSGAGVPTFGDVSATLPMNSRILTQVMALAKGTHIPSATVEMCKPGEVTGSCTLELSLADVMVVGVDVRQDPTQATVTVVLNFAREKVSVLPGTPQARTFEWNIAENVLVGESGATLAASTRDTVYTTTLPGSKDVISTRSWSQSSTQLGTTHLGGGGAGKPEFHDIVAETRTGHGTIALFSAVSTGEVLPSVEIAGCETSNCASKMALSSGLITSLVLGSPDLFDQVQFTYGALKWDRNDDLLRPNQNRTFSWDVAANVIK